MSGLGTSTQTSHAGHVIGSPTGSTKSSSSPRDMKAILAAGLGLYYGDGF